MNKVKKMVLIILVFVVAIILVFQVSVYISTSKTPSYQYNVDRNINSNIELRTYKNALFTRINLEEDDFKQMSYKGFRVLAGYIFGGNDENKKIAMT